MDETTLTIFRILSDTNEPDEAADLILTTLLPDIGIARNGYLYRIYRYLETAPRRDGIEIEDASHGVKELLFGKEG